MTTRFCTRSSVTRVTGATRLACCALARPDPLPWDRIEVLLTIKLVHEILWILHFYLKAAKGD